MYLDKDKKLLRAASIQAAACVGPVGHGLDSPDLQH